MGEPLQLIYLDPVSNQFRYRDNYARMFLSDEAIEENIKDLPVAIVSINGDCRKGKSFLLNFFLRYLQRYGQENWIGTEDEPLTGFPWRDGVDRETNGIVVWSKPFILTRSDGKRVAVLLMDTQGLFDDQTDHKTVEQFYYISSFISSIQIYNQMRNIQSNDITILSKFNEYATTTFGRTGHTPFQKLLFLLRDWPNRREYNFGLEGGRRYLLYKKQMHTNAFHEKWSNLAKCYSDIDCFLMPSSGEEIYEPGFKGQLSKLKPEFVQCLKELIPSLLSPDNIIIKSWEGKESKLWQVVNLFEELTNQLTKYGSINIEDLSTLNNSIAINNAFLRARGAYMEMIAEAMLHSKDVEQVFDQAEALALAIFEEDTISTNEQSKDLTQVKLIKFFADFRERFSSRTFNAADLAFAARAGFFNFDWKSLLFPVLIGGGFSMALKAIRLLFLGFK